MRSGRVLIALAVCAALAAAAKAQEKQDRPETAARAKAEAWLALVDAGKYGESWDGAAQLFKKAVTREQWTQAAGAARDPLGKLVSRTLKSAEYRETLPGAPDGKYVVIQFDASFANKRAAVETVTPMLDPDGQWRVSGYFIR